MKPPHQCHRRAVELASADGSVRQLAAPGARDEQFLRDGAQPDDS